MKRGRGACPCLSVACEPSGARHEDARGLFADVKLGDEFSRFPVNTQKQRDGLLARIDRRLAKV